MTDKRTWPYTPPTAEDIRRAKKMMRKDARGLDELSDAFLSRFKPVCRLNHFEILPQIDVDFRAYIFFDTDDDLAECRENGTIEIMRSFICEELSIIDRNRSNRLALELDSFENVRKNFEGSYFLRMRS